MGGRPGLVETVTTERDERRPEPKPPRRRVTGPPQAIQVIARPRCPHCKTRNVWVHRTEGDMRYYHCRDGCEGEDGAPFRFKVRMV